MKKMTIEEWGNAIYSNTYKVIYIIYEKGITVVENTETEIRYSVTYNGEHLILEELHDDKKA